MEDTKTIPLDPPIEFNGQTYSALELREPTLGDLIEMQKGRSELEQMQLLLHRITGMPKLALLLIPARQLKEAGDFIEGFMAPSLPTGAS